MITYGSDASSLRPGDLTPFFEGWPTQPSLDRRLAALRGADLVALAYDDDRLIGFATALTDGALMAHLAVLEVVASHRRQGVGTELVRALVARLDRRYGLDLCCDEDVVPFNELNGFSRVAGMVRRAPDALA